VSKRTLIALSVALVFVLAITAPVFAQDMSHTVEYNLNGTIDLEKTVGHFCNTGAEMKQTIKGAGTMTKVSDIYMKEGFVTVEDSNDFVAAATSSLTVTTAIKLCAPPKYVFGEEADGFGEEGEVVPVVGPRWDAIYRADGTNFDDPEFDALTQQIWAVQVSADPGFSGRVDTNFTAASGPYGGLDDEAAEAEDADFADDEFGWYRDDSDEPWSLWVGEDFVGQYFMIDQFARTSQGTTKRYIDISSPFSHAFLHEDMTVVGRAEVRESFEMMNIAEGSEASVDWWNLF